MPGGISRANIVSKIKWILCKARCCSQQESNENASDVVSIHLWVFFGLWSV